MPFFSQMVTIGESQYLDGAVSNAIPVKWALEQGYDKVIVVLTRDKMYQKKPVSKQVKKLYAHHFKEYPKLVEKLYTMPERYNQIKKDIEEHLLKAEDDIRNGRVRNAREVFKEWKEKYGI